MFYLFIYLFCYKTNLKNSMVHLWSVDLHVLKYFWRNVIKKAEMLYTDEGIR